MYESNGSEYREVTVGNEDLKAVCKIPSSEDGKVSLKYVKELMVTELSDDYIQRSKR